MASRGTILAIGGAEDKLGRRAILRRFVEEAGGPKARLAIVPTASTIPARRIAFYRDVFAALGAEESVAVPVVSREDAESAEFAARIAKSTGIFLTGGDQSRLVELLSGTRCLAEIFRRHRRGTIVAGTSAAASAFSTVMIAGGGTGISIRPDSVKLASGFGLLDPLIIDQHFSERARLGRLLSAVARERRRLGVGLDEDTAIACRPGGEIEVVGSGQVFVVDGASPSAEERVIASGPITLSGIRIHVLREGDRFDTRRRRMLSPVRESVQAATA